ncbi:MAG: hypothetical protein JSU72_12690 [Deltaproteobacteria bacterium]|nr:MAG: hypothetical protein JSU72_12690 [Deltaproteobacteria bacterium]
MERKRRKDKYLLRITKTATLQVHDKPGHTLTLTEMEGEPIELTPGVAGEFVSRRSVTFHDRTKGSGPMQGYIMANFKHGAVHSTFEGHRDSTTKISTGTWKTYNGIGILANIKGEGTFKVLPGERRGEYVLEFEGEYEL